MLNPKSLNFTRLHNISKHILHFKEGLDAVTDAIAMVKREHERLRMNAEIDNEKVAYEVEQGLDYLEGLFSALKLRVKSLDTRVHNVIQLTFHIAQAENNAIIQKDSKSLKVLAVLTFIFLPATALAAMFQTPFLDYDPSKRDEKNSGMSLSKLYWIFFVVTVPIILFVLVIWYFYEKQKLRKLARQLMKTAGGPGGMV